MSRGHQYGSSAEQPSLASEYQVSMSVDHHSPRAHQVYPPPLVWELSSASWVASPEPSRSASLNRVMYLSAAMAAVVASPDAVVTWRVSCARRSPATNNPGIDDIIALSVSTYPMTS